MRYAYYPGCSITRSARAYADSTEAVAGPLGIELVEIDDWNCCGATEYIAINKSAAYALVGRNLALAAEIDDVSTLTAPCSACYLNLKKVDRYMGKYPDLGERTNTALAAGGLHYKPGALEVKHLLDVITEDVGMETIAERVTQPLTGIKLAPYYGCLIARPELDDHPIHDTEYPTNMDDLLTALGAEVVAFPVKTNCCGGHMAQISADTAYDLIGNIISVAEDAGADAIVTICPMCQLNLDAYQTQVSRKQGRNYKMPILYFTQMIGLAMGMKPSELGFGQEIVSGKGMLSKIGMPVHEPAGAPHKPRARRNDPSLPMPGSRGER
ncbi:MAG: CoB--CoM heterodisulfide reductase iron-sulfur subunit B family protein [Anaerolineales bacterium]|nr:CoB--CoM heterodisulfide reductase iron-sulfur subunit B family protein [Anaerolineales bacterium]